MKEEIFRDIIDELPIREQVIAKQSLYFYILNNNKYKNLPISSIILAILEHLTIEGSLKNRGVPFDEIKLFLQKVLVKGYDINFGPEELEEFTVYILKKITNDGSAYEYEYFNTKTNGREIAYIRYIISKLDRYSHGVLFYITTEGMELLLNTKEVADEYKISMQTVLLQKMIRTNNLEDVLRTVKNINAEIKRQINKKQDLIETLQYAPEEKFNEYLIYKETSIRILKEDDGQLEQVKMSIHKYEEDFLNNINKKELSKEKEEHIKRYIHRINRELDLCLSNHHDLLNETVKLIDRLPTIQRNRLQRLFSSNFNIEEKVNLFIKNNDTNNLKYIIQPLLKPNISKIFNINKLDAMFTYKNKIEKVEEDTRKELDLGLAVTFDSEIDERMDDNYTFYMRNLLIFAKEYKKTDLTAFINYISNTHGQMPLLNSDFIPFVKDLLTIDEYSYKSISEKDHKDTIEQIFINVIEENKYLDLTNNKFIFKSISNDLTEVSERITVTNISVQCEEI